MKRLFVMFVVVASLSACSARRSSGERLVEVQENAVPGTVSHVWEEYSTEQVRIPGQIDPSGTYYRKSHSTLVDIRPGRKQIRQFPADEPREQLQREVLLPR